MKGKELVGDATCVLGCTVAHVFEEARREFVQEALKDPLEALEEYLQHGEIPVYVKQYCDRVIAADRAERQADERISQGELFGLFCDDDVWFGN